MARLIDATRIEQYILNNCSDNEEINAIYGEIINAPTIEAEPIVRCKDCRYNYANMIPNGKGCQRNVYIETADNWYCADGEREDEVEE